MNRIEDRMRKNGVALHTRVRLREVKSGRETEIVLTGDAMADPKEGRVSVLSPIGRALYGKRENELVSWRVPGGQGVFEIVRISPQPKAAERQDL
jgi:transcription elongation GreA/GreB family factor